MTSKLGNLIYAFDSRLKNFLALTNRIADTDELLQAYELKKHLSPDFPILICIIGGTGAGKSLLFNSLTGSKFSDVGVIRPCTRGAVICAPSEWMDVLRQLGMEYAIDENTRIVTSDRVYLSNAILVDTPDFDSVERGNLVVSERFFILSDLILFVVTEEKYADLLGRNVIKKSLEWGKEIRVVLNKALTESVFKDFSESLEKQFGNVEVFKIDRVQGLPEILQSGDQIAPLLSTISRFQFQDDKKKLRISECDRLRSSLLESLESTETEIQKLQDRTERAIDRIDEALGQVTEEMESRLQVCPSEEVERKIQVRLADLLRKYDILYVPRAALRSGFDKLVSTLRASLFSSPSDGNNEHGDSLKPIPEFVQNDSKGPLPQLEASIAELNLMIADILLSEEDFSDFRLIVSQSCPRLSSDEIENLYRNSFPEIEQLLEAEFEKFKDGLSKFDEIKLYSSYTLWALFLVTAEITIGGGITLLDMALNSVIVPFIPKWLLKLKIIDILRDIAQRIDEQRREALRNILKRQANVYINIISELAPGSEHTRNIAIIKSEVENFTSAAWTTN